MNDNNIFIAGDCGSDSCGSFTHTDTFTYGKINLDNLQAGSCDSDSCGCFTHKNILIA
jgi:hypothetical protein